MALLFDLDGTLLDTAPDFLYVVNKLRTEEKLSKLSLQDIRSSVSHGLAAVLKAGFGYSKEHSLYESLAKRFLHDYRNCLGQHTQQFPGIPELLSLLEDNDIPWGIVTNKPAHLTEPLLEIMNLKDRAACIVSGDTTPNPKPHPAHLLLAAKNLKIEPQNCIYIGDAACDIVAGKAANMTTVCALFGYIHSFSEAKEWQADHYIEHASEIWPIITQRSSSMDSG